MKHATESVIKTKVPLNIQKSKIFYSGKITLFKHNKSSYFIPKNTAGPNTYKMDHMFSSIKVDGGHLIRFHTSHSETALGKGISNFTNIPGDNIIRYSNPMFYISNQDLTTYASLSYRMVDFPFNFRNTNLATRQSLEKNLKNGYTLFLKNNNAKLEDKSLVVFGPNKSDFISKKLDLDYVYAAYTETNTKVFLSYYLGVLPKNLSKVFIISERTSIDHFEQVHNKIVYGDDIGTELTSNWT